MTKEFIPLTILVPPQTQNAPIHKPPMLCLLDSGATGCWILCTALPPDIQTNQVPTVTNQTLGGSFTSNELVNIHNLLLPEFHRTRHIETVPAKIFNNGCHYDMILGKDFMTELGIVLDFKHKTMEWDGSTITMCEYPKDYQPMTFATASIVTNQWVYEEFNGYFECLNIVFVVLFLTLRSLFVLLRFPTLGLCVISSWD